MTRENPRTHVSPREQYADVLDFTADLGFDAVEFGDMSPETVAAALEEAADELRERGHMYADE